MQHSGSCHNKASLNRPPTFFVLVPISIFSKRSIVPLRNVMVSSYCCSSKWLRESFVVLEDINLNHLKTVSTNHVVVRAPSSLIWLSFAFTSVQQCGSCVVIKQTESKSYFHLFRITWLHACSLQVGCQFMRVTLYNLPSQPRLDWNGAAGKFWFFGKVFWQRSLFSLR